jgi:hypothetical protein
MKLVTFVCKDYVEVGEINIGNHLFVRLIGPQFFTSGMSSMCVNNFCIAIVMYS